MGLNRIDSGNDLKRISFAYKKAFNIDQETVLFLEFSNPPVRPRYIQVRAKGYNDVLDVGVLQTTGNIQYLLQDDKGVYIDLDDTINDVLADKGLTLSQIQLQDKMQIASDELNKVSRIYGTQKSKYSP